MVFGSIVSSPRSSLSPLQALKLANVYLESASRENDLDLALVLCSDTEVSLYQVRKAVKRIKDQKVIDGIATAYIELGKLLDSRGQGSAAKASYEKAAKLG